MSLPNAPDDNAELMIKACLLPRIRRWRKKIAVRLWEDYLSGLPLPIPVSPRIGLGWLQLARVAQRDLRIWEADVLELLERHGAGDHGENLPEDDVHVNNFAKCHGGWVLSSYLMPRDERILVLTRPCIRTFVLAKQDLW